VIIILDMLIYWQHVAFHHIPALWALHKVHHADRDIDVTTGARFHPAEIVVSMVYKMALVVILGAPVIAVIIFELVLNGCAMFNHSNLKLPARLDRILRRVIVTPDMHRVHHSARVSETNSNYGFSLSIWDRLFGSYIAQPEQGHEGMTIGLEEYQTPGPASLLWSLCLPLRPIKRLERWF
jgi:sterol desaturase/sphingolipid hydroxylase (fatty acid hydroxylase superfamily)